jgi:hypothetical protein
VVDRMVNGTYFTGLLAVKEMNKDNFGMKK